MQEAKKLEDIIKSIVRRSKKRSKRFCIFLLEKRISQLFDGLVLYRNLKIIILP